MSADSDDQEQTAVRRLSSENQRLKQRLFDLEEKIRKMTPGSEGQSSSGSSVLKLIEHKDFQLQQYSARLEEKKEQLEEATKELDRKKTEVNLWMSAVRLCQELFENDATALIGVNREGLILLFNHNAPQILGEKFRDRLHQPIETVDFRAFDPDTPRRLKEALASGKPTDSTVVVRDRRILTTIQPVGKGAESRGALIRIQSLSAK
jgi:PAS domain-containing protein